jgi:hypothetical protein
LYCRSLAKNIRQRVQETDQKGYRYNEVFPERIAIHDLVSLEWSALERAL